MEADSGIAGLVQQSFGTSALFPSYVFVTKNVGVGRVTVQYQSDWKYCSGAKY
jgi:hypothetical protein